MKKLLINENNVVIYISDICEIVENGFFVGNNLVFNPTGLHVEEVESVAEEIVPQKYCYTSEEGFYINPDYTEPSTEEQVEEDKEIIG